MCLASFGNDAGRQKDKQETANLFAREYKGGGIDLVPPNGFRHLSSSIKAL